MTEPTITELAKAYDPAAIEEKWAEYWAEQHLFDVPPAAAEPASGQAFTMLLPPPNVTGRLHMGHMLNQTEMDILTRWHRMCGETALWVPGTDHAGIATQMMVEKQLAAEGKTSRKQLGREAFTARVWEWKQQYGGAITDQMRRLGASVDWSREYFTMDDDLSAAVTEAFVRLWEQGLIYRGAYIVNWDPVLQSAVSDLEVESEERAGKLYSVRYQLADESGSIVVATTRPETLLGDTAVAVNPSDARYNHLVGKRLKLPLTGRAIPIVADEWANPEFGTGAVKVTPAHDPNDFAIGRRRGLANITILDQSARIDLPAEALGDNDEGRAARERYQGLDRFAARKLIVEDLEAAGHLVEVKDHQMTIPVSQRSGSVIEPRLSDQWFIKIQPLADKAIAAVREGHIRFTPEMYEKTYFEWMGNIHDWCISRQLWWGHRIPAWHCQSCSEFCVARTAPAACAQCGSTQLTQETDVLDTWFSSGLLPFTVFGWPRSEFSVLGSQFSETAKTENKEQRTKTQNPEGEFSVLGSQFSETAKTENKEQRTKTQNPEGEFSVPSSQFSETAKTENKEQRTKTPNSEGEFSVPSSQFSETAKTENKEQRTKTPNPDLTRFYPTSLLVTGFDILFFWVARMIMLGTHFMLEVPMPDGSPRQLADAVPFREVYIHALVRDADRQKMSKTKGNVIDPIDIIKRFGTDAVRFTLASMASPGTDIAFSEERTDGYRAFANKIWNAARFLHMQMSRGPGLGALAGPWDMAALPADVPLESRWMISRLSAVSAEVERALGLYRFDEAASAIYRFFWGEFCDWYLELVKLRLDLGEAESPSPTYLITLTALFAVFGAALRLLSPFMPFITEELWASDPLFAGFLGSTAGSIALTRYPQPADFAVDPQAEADITLLKELIVAVRAARKDLGVPEKEAVPIRVFTTGGPITGAASLAAQHADMLARMARVSAVEVAKAPLTGAGIKSTPHFDLQLVYERVIDVPAERERLTKDLAKYEKGLAAAESKLNNEAFLSRAPAPIVETLRKQAAETRVLYDKTKAALADLD